jgi:hypothetical protein
MSPLEANLRATLSMVNEWLRYAETKNGALIAANGALIFGVTQLQTDAHPWALIRVSSAVLLTASLLIALLSLMPWLARTGLFPTRPSSAEDNLIFFGDASRYDAETYLHHLLITVPAFAAGDQVARWLADQIVVNSRIASRKFFMFNIALYLAAAGIVGIGSMVAAGLQTK